MFICKNNEIYYKFILKTFTLYQVFSYQFYAENEIIYKSSVKTKMIDIYSVKVSLLNN